MKVVVLDGWRPGLNKIALTKLIQQRAGLSLAAAKRQTDRLLEGEEAGILLPDSESAEDFVSELQQLGASAHVLTIEVGAASGPAMNSGRLS